MAGKVNPWAEEAFKRLEAKRKELKGIPAVVEVEPGKAEEVASQLRGLGYHVEGVVSDFVFVDLPEPADFDKVSRLPYVKTVSVQKKLYPMALGVDELFKRVAIATDPLLSKLDVSDLQALGVRVKPAAEIPTPFGALATLATEAIRFAADPLGRLTEYIKGFPPVIARADWRLVTDTRKLMEAPDDNRLNTTYVGNIDTGIYLNPAIGLPFINWVCDSITAEPPIDTMGHGCLRNVKVYTSFCGLVSVEDLWNQLDTEPIPVKDGELKQFNSQVFTIGFNPTTGLSTVSLVKGVFRTKAKEKVVIETPMGRIEATPWHKFLVADPKKRSGKKRWFNGFELKEKRADELEARRMNNEGDWLVFNTFAGDTWSLGLDPKLAYLGGLIAGDGVIIFDSVNLKNGHVYKKKRGKRNELVIFDDDPLFLERISRRYGGRLKKTAKQNSYVLRICGRNRISKVIPFIKPPINDLEAFRAWIAGFFDAEGYVDIKKERVRISNVDVKLLSLLRDILNAVGIPCTITSGGESKGSRTYQLAILIPQVFRKFVEPYSIKKIDELKRANRSSMPSRLSRKIKCVGNYILVPVKSVKKEPSGEYFYDLADTTYQNYSANGFVAHNSWTHSCAFGQPCPSRYGTFIPVALAPSSYHVKVFTAFGPCSSFQIMKAMEMCALKGCKVVNMSLGGPLEGSVEEDPECVLAEKLYRQYGTNFIVAAGNDGEEWSINSPGASPYVLCVAAVDWKTMDTSSYSSRGPQARWYMENKDAYDRDYAKYGENFLKPDVAGIGGDRESQVVAAVSLWYDAFYDFIPDGFEMMIGTSMSTPHCSGLVALAIDKGLIGNVDDVKARMARFGEKSADKGYGLLTWSKLQ